MKQREPIPRRATFDTAAERYDRVRPGYPAELFDDLAALADLRSGSRVLEIGCGTGQATKPMLERGWRVLAVELGAELAALAQRNLVGGPDVEIVVAAFEDWALPSEPFHAVVSATAFHWVDPEIRVAKTAEALRPGGTLAIIETRRRPIATPEQLAALTECHVRWGSTTRPPTTSADGPPDALPEVERSELFDRIEWRRYRRTEKYSTSENREMLLTFSDMLALDTQARAGLLDCIDSVVDGLLGGRLHEEITNRLLVARRRV